MERRLKQGRVFRVQRQSMKQGIGLAKKFVQIFVIFYGKTQIFWPTQYKGTNELSVFEIVVEYQLGCSRNCRKH